MCYSEHSYNNKNLNYEKEIIIDVFNPAIT